LQSLLPQYEITGLLGRGGMGAVYQGRQAKLNRAVAIKLLPEPFTKGEDEMNFAKRFEQEAQAMAGLDHPAIVSVFDFGETSEGQLYFVMEFIDGMDIHHYLHAHGGKLPQEQALSIVAHVLDALGYAHGQGIVHRDIKPANILLNREGRVKIADFGLAKKFGEHADASAPVLTMSNVAVGTPDFVAPEALDSDRTPDHRADLYAVGVMLYQMLTGKLPRGMFQSPSELDSEVDPRLDGIVEKAMAANPDYRYASASAMRSDLDVIFTQPLARVEAGDESALVAAAVPVTRSVRGKRSASAGKREAAVPKKPRAALYGGIAAAAAIGLLVLATPGRKEEEPSGTVILPMALAEEAVEPERAHVAADAEVPLAEDIGKMPMPQEEMSQEESGTGILPVVSTEETSEPEPAPVAPAENIGETQTAEEVASATVDEEPSTKNEELLAIPGLQARLAAYLAARREQVADLASRYERGLDSRLNQAADAGDLLLARAFREEKTQVSELRQSLLAEPRDLLAVVAESATLPELPEDGPEDLVALRETWEGERRRIREDIDGKLVQSLQALEAELTRNREFEQAEAVMVYRESLGADLGGAPERTAVSAAPAQGVARPMALRVRLGTEGSTDNPLPASKEQPFENSLGMKFVPVPGTDVLFCIHETRWRDYEAYAREVEGVAPFWRNQTHDGFVIEDRPEEHPVVNVSWEDAQAFCAWLSKKEGRSYRLPTDREWSVAVGLGRLERPRPSDTPESLSGKVANEYPWGREWPPPEGAGNYKDEARKAHAQRNETGFLDGYDDGFSTTAPVMSFEANEFGIYDLGGNVWEWVEDSLGPSNERRILRGGCWYDYVRGNLLSSRRHDGPPGHRGGGRGFRVVLVSPGA